MTLQLDASTPAYVTGNKPWTTASFTPPVDSVLVCVVTADWFGSTPTITVTSTGLEFVSVGKFGSIDAGVVEFFLCYVGSAGGSARTVQATSNLAAPADDGGLKVFVYTGYDYAQPTANGTGGTNANNAFNGSVTAPVDGSWIVGGGVDWTTAGIPTSTDVEEGFDTADLAGMAVRKAATSLAGAETLNFDAAGAAAGDWAWGGIAVRPDTSPTPVAVLSAGAPVAGTTSITTAAYGAGWLPGDMVVFVVASNHATAEGTLPAVSGFTLVTSLNGGGGAQGAGTGNRRLTFFTREAQSGDDTTPSITLATGNVMIAASVVLRKNPDYTWDTAAGAFAAETTAGTAWSEATASDPGVDAADVLVLGCAVRDTSDSSAEGITATGATFSSVTERADLSSETGNDIALHVATTTVLTGPNSANPVRTATHSTSETGVMGVLRIRAVSAGDDFSGDARVNQRSSTGTTATRTASGAARPTARTSTAGAGSKARTVGTSTSQRSQVRAVGGRVATYATQTSVRSQTSSTGIKAETGAAVVSQRTLTVSTGSGAAPTPALVSQRVSTSSTGIKNITAPTTTAQRQETRAVAAKGITRGQSIQQRSNVRAVTLKTGTGAALPSQRTSTGSSIRKTGTGTGQAVTRSRTAGAGTTARSGGTSISQRSNTLASSEPVGDARTYQRVVTRSTGIKNPTAPALVVCRTRTASTGTHRGTGGTTATSRSSSASTGRGGRSGASQTSVRPNTRTGASRGASGAARAVQRVSSGTTHRPGYSGAARVQQRSMVMSTKGGLLTGLRIRVSGREPRTMITGSEPPVVASGREPVTRIVGQRPAPGFTPGPIATDDLSGREEGTP